MHYFYDMVPIKKKVSILALVAFTTVLVVMTCVGEPAWGAVDLEAFINPDAESSPFKVRYHDQIEYAYGDGSLLHQYMDGKQWVVEGTASGGQDIQNLEEY